MENTNEDFKKCNCCGKFFKTLTSNKVCLTCSDSGYYDYIRVRNYVRDNPGVSVVKISIELNIKVSRILKFVDEGKFDVVDKKENDLILNIDDLKSTFE